MKKKNIPQGFNPRPDFEEGSLTGTKSLAKSKSNFKRQTSVYRGFSTAPNDSGSSSGSSSDNDNNNYYGSNPKEGVRPRGRNSRGRKERTDSLKGFTGIGKPTREGSSA